MVLEIDGNILLYPDLFNILLVIKMLKKIKDKVKAVGDKHQDMVIGGTMGWYNLGHDLTRSDSKIKCDNCGGILGFIRMVLYAKKVNTGEKYLIPCRRCGFKNARIKGVNE